MLYTVRLEILRSFRITLETLSENIISANNDQYMFHLRIRHFEIFHELTPTYVYESVLCNVRVLFSSHLPLTHN